MSEVFLISDLHLGHDKCAIRRGFESAEEQDQLLIENWNSVVTKRDTVWILGDITMEKTSPYPMLDELKGIKNVVLGNHDLPQHTRELSKYVNKIGGAVKLHNCILTHIPVHEQELYRMRYNIHGHVHTNTIRDFRYVNVCAEMIDYTPYEFSILLD